MTNDWMKEDLHKSGISPELAKDLGIEPADSQKCRELLCAEYKDEAGKPVEGYMIPFSVPTTDKPMTYGKGSPYIRLRLKEPARMKENKPAKYLTPKGAGQHAYILKQVHEAIGSGKPVILTEGEKKAICATQNGLPCIGLVGNWGWKIGGTDILLPELAAYAKVDTTWYVIWDSDANRKLKAFRTSSCRLAKVLKQYGVVLKMVVLSDINSNKKTGLDDFAMSRGDSFYADIQALLNKAEVISEDQRAYTSKSNGQQGGRPPVATDIAYEFFKKLKEDGKSIVYHRGTWYIYRHGAYFRDSGEAVKPLIMEFLQKNHRNHATVNMQRNILEHMKTAILCGSPDLRIPCQLESPDLEIPHYMVMKNCLVAPKMMLVPMEADRSVMSHTPDYILTNKVPYAYDPFAECPEWMKCVETLLPDREDQQVLQMLFGLALVPDTRYNVFFILHGPAGTGKSVVAEVLRSVVGTDNVSAVPLNKLNERFVLYPLTENLLNLIGDSDPIGYSMIAKAEGLLKDICSGGTIEVERKHRDSYTAKVTARCVYVTNHLPQFRDSSNGVWDRMRIIPFNKVMRNTSEETPDLAKKLTEAELPGIFNWAVRGLKALNGLKRYPESEAASQCKQKLRSKCDPIRSFIEERTQKGDGFVSTVELYEAYRQYIHEEMGSIAQRAFNARVEEIYPNITLKRQRTDFGQRTCWMGLSLIGRSNEVSEDVQEQMVPLKPETSLTPVSGVAAGNLQNRAPVAPTNPIVDVEHLLKPDITLQSHYTKVRGLRAPAHPLDLAAAEASGGISIDTAKVYELKN